MPIQDDLRPDLSDFHLGAGKSLTDPCFQVLGIDRDPDPERDRTVGLVPESQTGRAGHLPLDIQEVRSGLVVERLDVGDRRVGDQDPGQIATGLDRPELALDHADLGFGLVDDLDQVGDVPGDLVVGSDPRRARGPLGSQPGVVAGILDQPGPRDRTRWPGRVHRGFDRNHARDRLGEDRRR